MDDEVCDAVDEPGYVNASVLRSLRPGDMFRVRRGSEDTSNEQKTCQEDVTEMRIRRQRAIKRRKTSRVEPEHDMVYLTVREIVHTERRYVARLDLLHEVSLRNAVHKAVSEEVMRKILPNLTSILKFHKEYLLPRLEDKLANWSVDGKIGDLFRQCQPFLRQYSDYIVGLKDAQRLLAEWSKKSAKFANIVADIQVSAIGRAGHAYPFGEHPMSSLLRKPECDNLKLETHMVEPIQRLPRYQLLLETYAKHLPDTSPDVEDAKVALSMIKRVADYADDVLLKTDNHQSTLNAYRKIRGELSDSVRKRVLVKEGLANYIDGNTGHQVHGYLFLFTDVLLMCEESSRNKYTLRDELFIHDIQLRSGTGDKKNFFLVISKNNAFEFTDKYREGRCTGWYQEIKKLLDRAEQKRAERMSDTFPNSLCDDDGNAMQYTRMPRVFLGKWAPRELCDDVTESCLSCHRGFDTCASPKKQCRTCSLIVCENCCRSQPVLFLGGVTSTVCLECHCILNSNSDSR